MKTVKRLFRYIKPLRLNLFAAMLSALIGIALSLLVPVLIGRGVDCIIGEGNVNFYSLNKICLMLLASIAGSAVFQWIMAYCSNKLSFNTVKMLRTDVFKKINSLPLKTIDSTAHGDIINTVITDIDIVSQGLLQGFTQVLSGAVTILGTLVFMLLINPYIALVVIVLTPLSFFVASFIAKRSHSKYTQQAKLRGELTGFASEMIDGADVVTSFNMEEKTISKFEEMNSRWQKVGVIAHFYSALTNPCTRFVNSLVYASVAVFGAVSAVNGIITVGALASFLAYCSQYTKPFNEISAVVAEFQNAISSAERVFTILDSESEPEDNALPKLSSGDGVVEFDNVSFSYNKAKPFITDMSLKAESGQTVAIVGKTGCGKTTLINLLMRFYDTDSGEIKIHNQNIASVTRESLRDSFGMVLQDTWLFSGTVEQNIAYGVDNATHEQVVEAARKAHAHSFIKRLPDGYETVITGNGENLSQGQRQLICIARVMLSNPAMLILDEATSSIDTMTEVRIQKAFLELMQGRTSFIVAHRLSTIRNADIILVMDAGRIVEKGTHDELIASGGLYSELYNSQFAVS